MTSGHSVPGKASFAEAYEQPDPRGYFRALGPYEYVTPHHAQRVFRLLTAAREPRTVVDLCCSYGINAALLNHQLTLAELYHRYTDRALDDLSTPELSLRDRQFYAARRRPEAVPVVGVDVASGPVEYARRAGLLAAGFAENLERTAPSPALRATVADAGLVTVTGGVGYVSAQSFDRLLACVDTPPWVAAFVLRAVPYGPIAEVLAEYGLVTERLARTFRQRRFTGIEERAGVLSAVLDAGLDPAGLESEGWFHAELYVSRPAPQVQARPLATLLRADT
ncbi:MULTISPECIES: hypothetical protein [unclassified Kitasatospora]|uniref:hypothetical protein n=1 Tax=unclassified Kitasatospora TaxID=2633591 RepID=UPI00070E5D79|nr:MULTISPECIES: hypothetical protein [unclassified Kitasatospora]KQV04493.1 hypothetical protein ASC99_13885 [Kitasatospora sp. Root107]KRB60976.1 hypothetical protein ASE03_11615 [Kitasatospora sp. Root187]